MIWSAPVIPLVSPAPERYSQWVAPVIAYDDSEARDSNGEWTSGGGGGATPSLPNPAPTTLPDASKPVNGVAAESSVVDDCKKLDFSPEEKQAIIDYTNWDKCSEMNGYLRGSNPNIDPELKTKVETMQQTFSKYMTPHPVNVMRGVENSGFIPEGDLSGQKIKNMGFTSTSFNQNVPEEYCARNAGPGKNPVIMDIHVPQGYNALPASAFSTNVDDHELVLPHESELFIHSEYKKTINGQEVRCLKAIAMPPAGKTPPPAGRQTPAGL